MAKMFYTMKEAMAILKKPEDDVLQYCREGRLREFRDGPRLMFKSDQVDRLRQEISPKRSVEDDDEPLSGDLLDLIVDPDLTEYDEDVLSFLDGPKHQPDKKTEKIDEVGCVKIFCQAKGDSLEEDVKQLEKTMNLFIADNIKNARDLKNLKITLSETNDHLTAIMYPVKYI